MATWWQCAILIPFTALFAWMVQMALASTGPGVLPHALVPLFGVWLYATLSAFLNHRSVVVTPEHLVMANGPIPVRPRRRLPRNEISFAYVSATTTVSEGGESIVLFYTAGVETRTGAHVQVFGEFKDDPSARTAAQRIADGFGPDADGRPMEVRELGLLRDDPGDRRIGLTWVGVIIVAVAAGVLWDLV
jgi:hypothetical protein